MLHQGLVGASKSEGSVAIVRMGQLNTVHESVRDLHIGACADRFGRGDVATRQAAGAPEQLIIAP